MRQAAVEAILERNPNAFRPKIQVGVCGDLMAVTATSAPVEQTWWGNARLRPANPKAAIQRPLASALTEISGSGP